MMNDLSLKKYIYIFIYITDYPLHHIIATVKLCLVISSENTAMCMSKQLSAMHFALCVDFLDFARRDRGCGKIRRNVKTQMQ